MQQNDTGTIAFCELACKYFPKQTKTNAVRNLNKWINRNEELNAKLLEAGFLPRMHQFVTPRQHAIIVEFLGDYKE